MIVRMLIRLSFVNALFCLLLQQNGVDARIISKGGSSVGKGGYAISEKFLLLGEERSSKYIETSSTFENLLKIRGGQAISGKKVIF